MKMKRPGLSRAARISASCRAHMNDRTLRERSPSWANFPAGQSVRVLEPIPLKGAVWALQSPGLRNVWSPDAAFSQRAFAFGRNDGPEAQVAWGPRRAQETGRI